MQVEIWSDVACPWCYVGKRRFDAALAGFEHRDEVEVVWRSFELDPQAPREREVDLATHLASKYGRTREWALEAQQRLATVGAEDGIDFHHEIARGGSTFDAHRLIHLAAAHGRADELKERLLRAYHSDGEPIGDPATLQRLATEDGLPAEEVGEVLAGERYAAEVRDDELTAATLGIHAVPFFVVDRAIAASGAQSPVAFTELLRQGWDRAAAPA